MQTLKNIKNQPPLSPNILTFLIHFPQFQLLLFFLVNQEIPFYGEITAFLRLDSQSLLEILVVAQLCTRIFIVTTLLLRQFVLRDKKSSLQILVLKFLKVKIKILIVMSLYWNAKACTQLGIVMITIAVFNIIVTIGQLIGTRILNSSFRFEQENLICQKNPSLIQPMLIFPIMYLLHFHGLFYASCLIIVRCIVQIYENFNNIENRAIQYCDYFSPLVMASFCFIEIISHVSGLQLLNNQNILFFPIIFYSIIYGANSLTQTLINLVPKYHLRRCTYFTKYEDKPSLLQTQGILHVSESEEKEFIVALRVLAKVYITKQKMEGLFIVKENPYHGSETRQDEFDLFWQEFNKIIINHRMYCSNVTCPCLKRVQDHKENSRIASSLFLQIMFTSLQKVLKSTNNTALSIIEKYFYIELLQKPIKNYFLLVKLKSIVKKSEEVLEVDLLMDETREMLGHLLNKEKAQNQHIEIDDLINFQNIMKNMKKQFIQISSEYKNFYDLFYTSFVDVVILKQNTKKLVDLKKECGNYIDEYMPKYSRNIEYLTYCLVYYTFFEQYTENSQKFKSKIINIHEMKGLNSQNVGNKKNNLSKNVDVLDPIYGAIEVDLVWKPGDVINVTKNICELFGYKMDEIQGQKVNKLMPSIFARYHDRYIKHFVQNGQLAMLKRKQKTLFGKNSKNFIFPFISRLKLQYKCGASFSSSALVKKTAIKSQFILLNNFGKIEEISQKLYMLLFQKSLKDDVSKIKRLNAYKMLLSLNHFVKNPSDMDDKIYEGIITTVENDEMLQTFYRNIDSSNVRNGQQFENSQLNDQQKTRSSKTLFSEKNSTQSGQVSQNALVTQVNENQKCWTNMKQMLKEFYMRIDIDHVKAYRVMYRFSNQVTSEFSFKILEITSIKEEIPQNVLKLELPKEMAEIGELYSLPEDAINRVKKFQTDYKANLHINNLMGPIVKQNHRNQRLKLGYQDPEQKSHSDFQRLELNQTADEEIEMLGNVGSPTTQNAQKLIQKSSIISSFSLKTFVNKTLESTLTVSIFVAFVFLVVICVFSTTIKSNYQTLQKDNSIIGNLMMNFESHLAIEELDQFYQTFSMKFPDSLMQEKKVLTSSMKKHLMNSIQFTDSDLSDELFFSPIRLKSSEQKYQEVRPTIATLHKIYDIFLIDENKAEYLSQNYHTIVGHLEAIIASQTNKIFDSSEILRLKIGALLSVYGFSLVALIALMIWINLKSIQEEQKIIDFLPFINKKQLMRKIVFFNKIMDDMKQNEDVNLTRIAKIESQSVKDLWHERHVQQRVHRQNDEKSFKKGKSLKIKERFEQDTSLQKADDLRFIRILKRDSTKITFKKVLFLAFLVALCLAVIVQTDDSFMQAHKKFMAYINIKQSVMSLENLVPRTLLTYFINLDRIIHSEQLVQFPDYSYETPTLQLFNLRLYLAQSDTNGTELANHLNQHLNTQICNLVDCNPNDTISKNTDVYFLTYRFINALEYLRKTWSMIQSSTHPKEDMKPWIQENKIEDLLKSLEQILELMRTNEQQISDLFSQQINSIGYQSLYFSLTLIPLLICAMYFMRRKFIEFVYDRIESIENTFKQFSWHILSENTYVLNYFQNKVREDKNY